jgi:hypothetical protein
VEWVDSLTWCCSGETRCCLPKTSNWTNYGESSLMQFGRQCSHRAWLLSHSHASSHRATALPLHRDNAASIPQAEQPWSNRAMCCRPSRREPGRCCPRSPTTDLTSDDRHPVSTIAVLDQGVFADNAPPRAVSSKDALRSPTICEPRRQGPAAHDLQLHKAADTRPRWRGACRPPTGDHPRPRRERSGAGLICATELAAERPRPPTSSAGAVTPRRRRASSDHRPPDQESPGCEGGAALAALVAPPRRKSDAPCAPWRRVSRSGNTSGTPRTRQRQRRSRSLLTTGSTVSG